MTVLGNMSKTIIIGAGINGLLIAALLADKGEEVHVFEKKSFVGGRTFVWEKDGFTVDYGIHVIRFGPYSGLSKILKNLGYKIDFYKMGTSYVLDYDNKVKKFPTSPKDILFSNLLTFSEKIKALIILGKIKYSKNYDKLLKVSVLDWMEKENITGGLRRYFELLSASILVCPFIEKASAGELVLNIQKILKTGYSALYPMHGWKPIHDFLNNKINQNGKIDLETTVTKIIIENGQTKGVIANEKIYEADKVIITTPITQLKNIVDIELTNIKPTMGISMDFGLKKKISKNRGWWYSYDLKAFGLFTSNLCYQLAPDKKQLFTILKPISEKEFLDKNTLKEHENKLKQAIFKQFPEFRENIEWERVLSLDLVDGVEVNIDQTRLDRPSVKVTGINNLFLCGDYISTPGAGGDIGYESVIDCYKEIKSPLTPLF